MTHVNKMQVILIFHLSIFTIHS